MTWMAKWVGGHPVYAASAHGARIEDVDGNVYVDFSLGDTAAMAGHSPPRDRRRRAAPRCGEQGGATLMLPTEDAAWVGEELAPALRRGAVELRADRDRRQPLGAAAVPRGDAAPVRARLQPLLPRVRRRDLRHPRRRAAAVARGQRRPRRRPDARPRGCASSTTSSAVERLLADGQVACVLAEPALTNIGIVLPDARLPRRPARGVRPHGHAAHHRRDAHHQRGAGRLHRGVGAVAPTS